MITLYSGTPGSGKSLYASYIIWNRLRSGKRVICNFNINFEPFKRYKSKAESCYTWLDNSELTPEVLVQFARDHHKIGKESQTLIIIDEASVLFNSRDFTRKDRMAWIIFFQQHRKLGYDVILIAQQDRMLDRQIRGFIETEYKYKAVKHYKLFGFLLSLIFGGMFVRVETWYGMRLRVSSQFFRMSRRKAKLYNTFEVFK